MNLAMVSLRKLVILQCQVNLPEGSDDQCLDESRLILSPGEWWEQISRGLCESRGSMAQTNRTSRVFQRSLWGRTETRHTPCHAQHQKKLSHKFVIKDEAHHYMQHVIVAERSDFRRSHRTHVWICVLAG